MANNDRVADVYHGRIEQVETQNACRDRVHWLCERVAGERILDLGCSQGIVSLILGREGHQVTGIDIEEASLAVAQEMVATEPEIVSRRIVFHQIDAFRAEFPPASFDSVVIGQVLEHLVRPGPLLARIREWLADDGLLVVSVPLGFHPYHDHKRTFYLTELLNLFAEHYSVREIGVVHDRYLCGVAVKPPTGEKPTLPSAETINAWSLMCNRGLENAQRRIHEAKASAQTARRELRDRLARLRADFVRIQTEKQGQLETMREQLADRNQRFDKIHVLLDQTREQLQETQSELQTERENRRSAERRARHLKDQCADARQELAVRLNEVRYKLGDALVAAATPSKATLLLPIRVVRLLIEGLKKRRDRRQAERHLRADPAQKEDRSTQSATAEQTSPYPPKPKPLPDWLSDLESAPHLEEPFSTVPEEQIVRKNLRIAAVMDEFSWRSWQYEADFYTFTPNTWKRTLKAKRPDLLLVESTWHGLEDGWHFQVRDLGRRPDRAGKYALPDIVEWCRRRGIPTVFYNKEDPPNFEFFVDAAKLFDFVFTSDANCIPNYREHLGHDRIFALPFAAQPRIHNPIRTADRKGNVCFAGTWYNHRHFDRQEGALAILKPALDFDLHIFDRMADSPSKNYRWPETYQPCVCGALPYAKMVSAYKRFKVFLNINSVTDSPTMFARRVFELLACGTPVLSSVSRGIEEILGGDLVLMAGDEEAARNHLTRLLADDEYRERLSLRGQRKVFSEHTYTHRLETILETVGRAATPPDRPRIAMIAAIECEDDIPAALHNFRRQTYDGARLILCTQRPSLAARIDELTASDGRITTVGLEQAMWGQLLTRAAEECDAGWVAAMNTADYYGPHYLTDYANAMLYVEGAAIGKGRYYVAENGKAISKKGPDYRFVTEVCQWTVCCRTDALREAVEQLRDCRSAGEWWSGIVGTLGSIDSADPFNYVRQSAESSRAGLLENPTSPADEQEQQQLAAALV